MFGLNQVTAGRFHGVDPRTSRRWASGATAVPDDVAMLHEIMAHHEITPAQARKLAGLPPPDQAVDRAVTSDMLRAVMVKHAITPARAAKLAGL